jgi:hypothetical protein
MLKSIRTMVILGSLLFPLAVFGSAEKSGDAQDTAKSDHKLAAKIHKALAKDNSLKAYASAVDVTVQNGVVTLNGTVRSDEQRADIQAKAESLAIQAVPEDRIHTVVVQNKLAVSP